MQTLKSHTCSCGKPTFESISRCPWCTQERSSSISETNGPSVQSPTNNLTPPPSQPSSPRKTTEVTVPLSSSTLSQRPRRDMRAGKALDAAFAFSFEQHNDDEDEPESGSSEGRDIFPPRFYRKGSDRRRHGPLSRTSSDSSSSGKDVSPDSSIKSPTPAENKIVPEMKNLSISSPSTPGEAPMAAAFARLARKDPAKEERRRRDLSARMFEGAA